ncbi:MAG: polysaccharide pyruvyl transferase family protein [Flavobacteriales bacterium]
MRIGLLTYHHVVNIGSVLQAYCAWRLLTQLYPQARVEIIDHVPAVSEKYKQGYRAKGVVKKGWFGKTEPNAFSRNEQAYLDFLRAHCDFSPALPTTDDEHEVVRAIAALGYDAVFVGSDTVFQLGGYFGHPIAAKLPPNAYYLPGLEGVKKVGLAASFDPYMGGAEAERLRQVAPLLQAYDRILYRDATAEALLCNAGVDPARMAHIPDPTILMDITHLVPGGGADLGQRTKRVAGVAIADPKVTAQVTGWVKEAGFEVVDFMYPPQDASRRSGMGGVVGQALGGYRELDLMVTDRFHGSILALQLSSANVVGIEHHGTYVEPNSKLRDLYQRLGIGDHLLRTDEQGLDRAAFEALLNAGHWSRAEMMQRMAALRASGFTSIEQQLAGLLN